MPRVKKSSNPKPDQDSPTWENRVVGHGLAKVSDLQAHHLNPRVHGDFQSRAVRANLKDLGWLKPVIVNKQTGRILDGHLRVKLAIQEGIEEVPVDYVDLPEDQESQALLTLDPLAELAEIESLLLMENMEAIQSSDPEVQEFLAQLAEQNQPPDFDKEPPDEFPAMDEDLETEHRCPKCGYEWSGKAQ